MPDYIEAIAPIVEAWKQKVAELEQANADLQQQLNEARNIMRSALGFPQDWAMRKWMLRWLNATPAQPAPEFNEADDHR